MEWERSAEAEEGRPQMLKTWTAEVVEEVGVDVVVVQSIDEIDPLASSQVGQGWGWLTHRTLRCPPLPHGGPSPPHPRLSLPSPPSPALTGSMAVETALSVREGETTPTLHPSVGWERRG